VRAGNQNILRTQPEFCAQRPFWKYLDDAGIRCLVFDAFMDSPLPGYAGAQVREYGTWTWFGEPGSSPQGLLKALKSEVGSYPGPEHSKVVTVPDPEWFGKVLATAAERKGEAITWLLNSESWQLAFVTINEFHGAAHYLWHLFDQGYPTFADSQYKNSLRDVFIAIDAALGNIICGLDDNTDILIVSCDGMGPNYSGCHLMPELLHKLGLFHATSVGGGDDAVEASKSSGGLLSKIRFMIPLGVRQAITQQMPRDLRYRLSMKWANSGIDWARTKVFCIPNNNEAYFRVNLRGREPEGIVEPGAEADQLVADLKVELQKMENPETGRSAARSVVRMDDAFCGPERPNLPDLVVTWNNKAETTNQIKTPSVGIIRRENSFDFAPHYTGNHRPGAFVIVGGPSFSTSQPASGGNIVDVAPTVFDILGVDIPNHFEGRSWLQH
ncbi:MAG: alkaline phosphatase family protein, partial [Pseudomonadota bacterium]